MYLGLGMVCTLGIETSKGHESVCLIYRTIASYHLSFDVLAS